MFQYQSTQRKVLAAWAQCAALVLVTLLAGCGVPGEPLPPLLEIPAAVTDLNAVQVGTQVELSWTPPRLTTEGTRVRELDRIEIYGAFLPPGAPSPSFPVQAQQLKTFRGDSAQQQTNYQVALTAANLGQTASFAVKAINNKGRDAGFSSTVSVEITNLPQAPSELKATVTETIGRAHV